MWIVCRPCVVVEGGGGGDRAVSSCRRSKRRFFRNIDNDNSFVRSFVRSSVRRDAHGMHAFFRRHRIVSSLCPQKTNDNATQHDRDTPYSLTAGARFPRGDDEPRLPEIGIEIRHRAQGSGGGGRRPLRARLRPRDRIWRFRGPFAVPVRDREFAGGGGFESALR